MAILVSAAQTAPPAPLPPQFPPPPAGLGIVWSGSDGSTWDLMGDGTLFGDGVRLLGGSALQGLFDPAVNMVEVTAAGLSGAIPVGFTCPPRDVLLPVAIFNDAASQDFCDTDARFRASLSYVADGVLTVTSPQATTSRVLRLRYLPDGSDTSNGLEVTTGWRTQGVILRAYQPFWEGPLVWRTYGADQNKDFFTGATGLPGPPLWISPAGTHSTATLSNPGDVDSYFIHVLDGPQTGGATIGVPGFTTTYTADIPAGYSVVIDTRPQQGSVVMIPTSGVQPGGDGWYDDITATGSNVYGNTLNVAMGVAVPAQSNQPITVIAAGGGAVSSCLVPLFNRAY